MGTRKQYDWIGENLANPDFTNTDFKNVGITIENTSIGPESVYTSNSQIRALPEFQTNGNFDEAKFHEKYVELATSYNNLARNTYYEDLKNQGRIFAENNVFVSPDERRQSSGAFMTIMNNPDHISYGIVGLNLPGPRTKTPMELAEQNKIYDSKTGKFTDYTVEESFFKDFWRPKIMATYDENVDINGNPTNDPTKIAHVKGEYKLDKNGEYYAEFANGRSTYGKEIVSPWNILTKEDSWINKYDPFDSDGISKSLPGTIARNALKIFPLFTPVAPEYIAASLGISLVDALGTLGKLVTGSNNPTLNTITAFAESFNLTSSEYAIQHPFSMENIINMVGDTFMFLESQKQLASYAPRLFYSDASRILKDPAKEIQSLTGSYLKKQSELLDNKFKLLATTVKDKALLERERAELWLTLLTVAPIRAQAIVNNLVQNFLKLGRLISTSMMAITFGLHTYGIAKSQEVSDEAATALTLGAIAGQYAILGSHLGLKIFPEASVLRQQIKKALEVWKDGGNVDATYKKQMEDMAKALTKTEKTNATKSLFKSGKNLAQQVWDALETIPGTVAASTVATGIEMMAFTALDDLVASTYNLASWLSGEENRMTAWDNIAARYGTSLIGGGIAGAMSAPAIYESAMKIRNMKRPQAFETIVYMINEGKEQDLIKEIDKHDWAPTGLSTEVIAERELENGEYEELFGTGTPLLNQNTEIKLMMKNAIMDIKQVLTTYGTIISKNSLLDVMINGKNVTKDIRFVALKESLIAQHFLEEYVRNQLDIYEAATQLSTSPRHKMERGEEDTLTRAVQKELDDLAKLKDDPTAYNQAKNSLSEEAKRVFDAKEKLRTAVEKNRDYFNGKLRAEFVLLALFEMQKGINMPYLDMAFYLWARALRNNIDFNKISENDKKLLAELFYNTKSSLVMIEHIRLAFDIFMKTNAISSENIKKLKNMSKNDRLNEFLSLLDDIKVATRNLLFRVANPDEGTINPYDTEKASPFDIKENTPMRPEEFIARMNFAGYAKNKKMFDSLLFMLKLVDRYSKDDESFKAINDLINLFDDLNLYRRFLADYAKKVEVSQHKYEEWLEKKEAAEAKGEQFTEVYTNEYGDSVPLDLKPESILREITQRYLDSRNKLVDEVKSEKYLKERIPEERVYTLFEKLSSFINVPAEKITNEHLAAALIRSELLDVESFKNKEGSNLINNPQIITKIIETIEAAIFAKVERKFSEELDSLLSGTGYLNDFLKEQLFEMVDYINNYAEEAVDPYRDNRYSVHIGDEVQVVDVFSVLNKVLGTEESERIEKLGKELENLPIDEMDDEGLQQLIQKPNFWTITPAALRDKIKNYNSDGVLEVADRLYLEMTGDTNKSVSKILQQVDEAINARTDKPARFLVDRLTKTEEFILSNTLISDINDAILILQMLRSSYSAATEEVESIFNHIGFNATANKLAKETKSKLIPKDLVTISAELVSEGIDNIQNSIYKLLYWREVAANAMQLRTEVMDRADLGFRLNVMGLIANKIDILEKEGKLNWKGISEFKEAISKLTAFNSLKDQLPEHRLDSASDELKDTVTKELISFEIALHDFFNKNQDILNDPKKLSDFISKENFTFTDKVVAINKSDKLEDDSAIMWYLASVAALDPKVFYSNLKDSLHEDRLPSAIQTTWKYTAVSMIANPKMFENFREAYIESYKVNYPDLTSEDLTKKEEELKKFAREFLSLFLNPKFKSTVLISSGPGFGKSTYIPELISLIEKIIPDFDKNKKLWICGPENTSGDVPDSKAIEMRDSIGAKETKTFTRETLMKMIVKNFDSYDETFKVIDGKLTGKNDNGSEKIFELDFETGDVKFDYELNEGLGQLPKVIVIDEISEFSLFDMTIIDDFATKNNIIVLAHGDFTQSGIYGTIKVNEGEKDASSNPILETHNLGLRDVQFIRGFKSQLSYRSTNTLADTNNTILRAFIEGAINFFNGREETIQGKYVTHYYFDELTQNFYGTYISPGATLNNEAKKYINGMYKTLKDDEKVTLIYSNDNSLAYKYIINEHPEWRSKTEFRKGTTLKSSENNYYIIDLNDIRFSTRFHEKDGPEIERLLREYYTGLTRQKKGTVVIDNITGNVPNLELANHDLDSNTQEIAMPEAFVAKRSLEFKLLLLEMFPETVKAKVQGNTPPNGEGPSGNGPARTDTSGGTGGGEFEVKGHKIDINEPLQGDELLGVSGFSNLSIHESKKLEEKHPIVIQKTKNKKTSWINENGKLIETEAEFLDYVLYTFNALRTGLTVDGLLSNRTDIEARRDCVYGFRLLAKLMGRTNYLDIDFQKLESGSLSNEEKQLIENQLIKVITMIHHHVRTEDNKDVLNYLYRALGLGSITGPNSCKPEELSMRYIVTAYTNKYDDLRDRHDLTIRPQLNIDRERERAWGPKGFGDKNGEVNRHEILLVLGKKGQEKEKDVIYLTIPVATIPNYRTLFNKGKNALDPRVQDIIVKGLNAKNLSLHAQDEKIYNDLLDLIEANKDNQPLGAATFIKLIDFYMRGSREGYLLHPDTQLVKTPTHPNGLFESLGWFVSASDRGFDYLADGYEATAKDLSTERLTLHDVRSLYEEPDKLVSNIYTVVGLSHEYSLIGNDNGIILKTGALYMLIADAGAFETLDGRFDETEMFNYLDKLLQDSTLPIKVKIIAVRPPQADFDTFIQSEHDNIFKSGSDLDNRLDVGNQFTIYRILLKVFTAHYTNGKDSPINKVCSAVMTLNFDPLYNLETVGEEILKLSYVEGQLSEERKAKILDIYDIAEKELDDTVKGELLLWIQTGNYNNVDRGHIYAIIDRLRTKPINKVDNTPGAMLKTIFRRFLLYIYAPGEMGRNELYRSYPMEEVQAFIKEAAKDLALLYNPEYEKEPAYVVHMRLNKNSSNTEAFGFHRVMTDSKIGDERFTYKKKPFLYASIITSGPLVGNLMSILDLALKMNKKLDNGRVIGLGSMLRTLQNGVPTGFADIFDHTEKHKVLGVSRPAILDVLRSLEVDKANIPNTKAINLGKNLWIVIYSEDLKNPNKDFKIYRVSDMGDKKNQIDLSQVTDSDLILEQEFEGQGIKYYKVNIDDNKIITFGNNPLNKPEAPKPLTDLNYSVPEKVVMPEPIVVALKSKALDQVDVVKYDLEEPLDLDGHKVKTFFSTREGTYILTTEGQLLLYDEYPLDDRDWGFISETNNYIYSSDPESPNRKTIDFKTPINYILNGEVHILTMLDLYDGKLETLGSSPTGEFETFEGDMALQILKEIVLPLNFEGLNEIVKDFIITDPAYSDSNKLFEITPESEEFSMLYDKARELTGGLFEPGSYSIPKLAELLSGILNELGKDPGAWLKAIFTTLKVKKKISQERFKELTDILKCI